MWRCNMVRPTWFFGVSHFVCRITLATCLAGRG
jgi:hypothetical protein